MFETNSLIKASAGTGKTFSLATRFIRLMMFDNVRPEAIVALTFSRAAAQEIYVKILQRLAKASANAEDAKEEWRHLLDDFGKDEDGKDKVKDGEKKLREILSRNIPHDMLAFRNLLRQLVESQHLGTIATIDSFILRFIQNFPKEMGFQNAVEVLDPIDESDAVEDALRRALSCNGDRGREIALAFSKAKDGDCSRTCIDSISRILSDGWRNFVIANPKCRDWTVESMCDALGVPMNSTCPDLSGIRVNEIQRRNARAPEADFIDYARTYDGHECFLTGDKKEEMIRFFWDNPDATSWNYKYYKEYVLDCGAEGAAAIRGAIRHMMNVYLKCMLEKVKAKIDLVKAVEAEYSRMTRRAGKLTFDDFAKFTAENELSKRGIAIKNVQFRFDSKFDHWALDEFQDTSELQWQCLKELVTEVAVEGRTSGSRSAMVVGDLKQSIYTWRGASAKPFDEISRSEEFDGCSRDIKESHRYGPNITNFINKVFGAGGISANGVIPAVCMPSVEEWGKGWKDHFSKQDEDYVRVIYATKDEDEEEDDEILPTLRDELKKLWAIHQEENSADTVGVLVRANSYGVKVAEYLRRNGLPAVWEGVNTVHDLPVVQAVLALLRLAEHPGDSAAWEMVNGIFPVREKVFPALRGAAAVSAEVSRMLSRQGLARTLKEICEKLDERFDESSIAPERLRQLVEAGAAFEGRSSGGVDDFIAFLSKSQKRELAASSKVIRVLSIHRSKGLSINHVFVPLHEGKRDASAIDRPSFRAPLFDSDQKWVLPHLPKGMEAFNPKTSAAYDRMRNDRLMESLRTYYVALTRAVKSMFVIFPDDSNPSDYGKGVLMRDLIVHAVGTLPYEMGAYPTCKPKDKGEAGKGGDHGVAHNVWRHQGEREVIERVSPSGIASFAHGKPGVPFDADYGAAAKRGVDVHAEYAKIEWADDAIAASLPEAFREAFLKPSPEATVWRERSYEFFRGRPEEEGRPRGGSWETGQFDRVVFTGDDENRSAVIYDFKTNVKNESETDSAFAARMRENYARQMGQYKKALASLTGIPPSRITAKLLLMSTGEALNMENQHE